MMLETIKSLPLTFYSAPFYRQLVFQGKGIGLGFLLIISLLNIAHIGVVFPYRAVQQGIQEAFGKMPDLSLEKGVLSMQAPSPQEVVLFEEPDKNKAFKIVFDMTYPEDKFGALMKKMNDEKIAIFVTSRQLFLNDPSQGKFDSKTYEEMDDFTITHEGWVKAGESLALYAAPTMLIPVFGAFFAFHFVSALLGGILLMMIAPLFKVKVDFNALLRLAAAAKVPLAALSLFVTPQLTLLALIWFGFAAFGLLSARGSVGKSSEIL